VFVAESKRPNVLTDTTFWIDLLEERRENRVGGASAFITRHRKHELYVSVITWGELAEGFEEYVGLEILLRGIRVLMLPQQIAWEASRIQRELHDNGGRLGENDSWIAATARAWGQRLVTRDSAFQRVPRLRLTRY
jgi:predicted nucleic acid-binding protein